MRTMKKYLFLAATAIVALASCSDNSLVGEGVVVPVENELTPITFSSTSAATTRDDLSGADAAEKLGSNFVVEGVKGNGTTQTVVYDHYNVNWVANPYSTTSNTNGWEYVGQDKHDHALIAAQTIKYWDYASSQYDFIAFSKGTATAVYSDDDYLAGTNVVLSKIDASKMNGVKTDNVITAGAYTIKGQVDDLAKVYIADLVTAYRDPIESTDYNKAVNIKFRPLSSKVRIGLYETVPGYSVKDVVFYTNATTATTDSKAYLYTTGSSVFNSEGTYTVYFPTTGSTNVGKADYNKAHISFAPVAGDGATVAKKAFGEIVAGTKVVRETAETNSTSDKLYIGRYSNAPTFFGPAADNHYSIVAPNEDGAVLNLKVDYTLLATDGSGEVINVKGATATVPAQYAQWKSGFAYTYLFKISDRTNGFTNPAAGPAGLYPITFDALVLDDEANGTQETITTVSEPSITTFGVKSGSYTYGKNEYQKGTTIYVTCVNADGTVFNPTLGDNTHIFNVTSTNEAVYPITEASVAESQQHPAGNKITVTHECCGYNSAAKVTSVPAEDGTTKTINAIKFTPTTDANKVFAIRYTTSDAVISGYSAGTVLAEGTSLEGYYRDKFEKATGTAVDGTTYYEKAQMVLGKVLPKGILLDGYYSDSECNTACTTGTEADGSTTYYIKVYKYTAASPSVGDDVSSYYIINGKEACGDSEWANGVNKYYTPTYSTNPGYAYKIIRVVP